MKLSIVTINYNDVIGLSKTFASVAFQINLQEGDLEHIIVDGGSTDASREVIEAYAESAPYPVKWISEPDKGIYNAMNKGIRMASGDYIEILNSADLLAAPDVVCRMLHALDIIQQTSGTSLDLLYGNMYSADASGRIIGKTESVECSLRQFYSSTICHDCCYIRRELFDDNHYGLYDENLKIVSDWKWFLCAIALGVNPYSHIAQSPIHPIYVDIDVTIFDTTGISERNLELRNQERRQVLEELLSPAVLADYEKHFFDMLQMDNLRRHPWAYKLVWTLERILNRLDNKNFKKPKK